MRRPRRSMTRECVAAEVGAGVRVCPDDDVTTAELLPSTASRRSRWPSGPALRFDAGKTSTKHGRVGDASV
jgi:hypothetical protein